MDLPDDLLSINSALKDINKRLSAAIKFILKYDERNISKNDDTLSRNSENSTSAKRNTGGDIDQNRHQSRAIGAELFIACLQKYFTAETSLDISGMHLKMIYGCLIINLHEQLPVTILLQDGIISVVSLTHYFFFSFFFSYFNIFIYMYWFLKVCES